ncbi:hypothetical protein [uncultured Sphingomonas sp.]|uniref:hypothetical protein n=1 Tax=uncultured Sphingomonas sp. TaxID=158754 RepID=UPI0025E51943|nr:hypothetical protein [uncultured Sphingomonas sp.]
MLGCAAMALSACGADDIASPGEGTIVTPPGNGGGTTPPGGGTTNPGGGTGPAANCPTGTIDRGIIATNWRNCELSGRISSDLTLQNLPGVRYSLSGPVNVGTDVGGDGNASGGQRATLTIQAGTVIFASQGNDYLVVNRGSKLNAIGTPVSPIVFTARANIEGTTTDSSQGLWGGIVLLGRAPISDCNTAVAGGSAQCQNVVEGTTSSLYGGATAEDSSGSLQYVQIRYSGFAIAPGNELQGLTLGGVGSGTTLDHLQIHNSSDDGIEIFGGRPNLKYLVVTGADDDALDTDLGYKGFIQFVIAAQRDATNGDSMVEADSNGNEDALPRQNTRLANFTFIQRSTVQGLNAMLLRGGTDYTAVNGVVVTPQGTACLDIDATNGTTIRNPDQALDDAGRPVFNSVVFSGCATPFRGDDNNVSGTDVAAVFNAGSNNNSAFTSSLTNVFVDGASERAVSAFNAASLGAFFTNTSYIGAVRDSADTWYANWTCNSVTLNFGSASANCAAAPAN